MSPTGRILSERSDRNLRSLEESFSRVRAANGVSLRTVLSNLQYLLHSGKALPDAVMTEENITLLMELVRNYLDFSAAAPVPSTSNERSRSTLGESRAEWEIPEWMAAAMEPPATDREIHEQIVSHVLMIFTLWSKSGSYRWSQPPSAYLVPPPEFHEREFAEHGGLDDCTSSMTILLHKRVSLAILNEYILKVLQQAHRCPRLMTKCFVQLAHSTIVLRSPEKNIPTQVFLHYMQYGPIRDLDRDEYLEILNALATLLRHMESLDQLLEVIAISLNSWNTTGSSFASRPFFMPLPPEAQHLPPTPLTTTNTQLIVTPPVSPSSPQLTARTSLPGLTQQFDIFNLYRTVVLWRRWDKGWTEAVDEEIHAAALTIQYWFVNGSAPAQVISLMAGMGVLEALVQSNSLTHPHTISVFYGMFTFATMRVARNDIEIRNNWRCWRQAVVVIASQFEQSFPNLDDSLLLQMVTDVFLEESLNIDYIFKNDMSTQSLEQILKKVDRHREAFIFHRIPLLAQTISAMFNHTKNPVVLEGTLYKLHSCAVRWHHMMRLYPKPGRVDTSQVAPSNLQINNPSIPSESSSSPTSNEATAPESSSTTSAVTPQDSETDLNLSRPSEAYIKLATSVEKAGKALLETAFNAYVAIFTAILPSLSYKQITRAIEALSFIEFAAPKNYETGEYSILLMQLVDRFHELRPDDNWIVAFLNFGIVSIFGGPSTYNREKSLKLGKPELARIRQLFAVVQHTCMQYPHFITRNVLEQRGLLALLFWMLENPHKSINRKAHQTFLCFFMQPELLANEPYIPPEHPAEGDEYIPRSFIEEIFPYYWKLTLQCYPATTKVESITATATSLLVHVLPNDSPLIPFLLNSLMDKISSLRLSKYAAGLTRVLVGLINIVPHSALPLLLGLIEDYVHKSPRKLQIFLCEQIRESTLKNLDYSRKEILITWCMKLIDSLGLLAKL